MRGLAHESCTDTLACLRRGARFWSVGNSTLHSGLRLWHANDIDLQCASARAQLPSPNQCHAQRSPVSAVAVMLTLCVSVHTAQLQHPLLML
eukprot:18367-Heterococcus_DN1.PRE.5